MRQQNPPSTHIKKAEEFEKYLRPGTLACLYGAIAVLCDSVIALVFAGLVLGSVLNPTSLTITIAAVVGCVPLLSALAAYWRRPHDPLSYYLGGLAKEWRRPLEVSGDECMFKTNIRTGDEMLLVKLRFQYPLKYQTLEIKERLYTHTHAALTSEFSMTYSLPGFSDVERALGPSVETLAAEYDIPVLFTEVLDIRKMRVVYDFA
ncbi:MAG: hypothetical protein ACRD3F_00930, partial [Acidobacteriaceae bacterium]